MDEEMYISGTPALCLHCGKLTMIWIRMEYIYAVNKEDYAGTKDINHIKWTLLQCPECLNPILMQADQATKREYPGGSSWKTTTGAIRTLYPLEKQIPSNLPEGIGRMYTEAIKVKLLSPSSCAVLIRRTLEAVCQHENATGRTLAQKLKNLADTGKIPQTLVGIATHLKQLGNLGAHFDINDDVTMEDVPVILDFVELLLEYLYVAPAKIQAVKDRLNNPQRNSSLAIDESSNGPF
jgi:Domain of unknown function (DUF4145)